VVCCEFKPTAPPPPLLPSTHTSSGSGDPGGVDGLSMSVTNNVPSAPAPAPTSLLVSGTATGTSRVPESPSLLVCTGNGDVAIYGPEVFSAMDHRAVVETELRQWHDRADHLKINGAGDGDHTVKSHGTEGHSSWRKDAADYIRTDPSEAVSVSGGTTARGHQPLRGEGAAGEDLQGSYGGHEGDSVDPQAGGRSWRGQEGRYTSVRSVPHPKSVRFAPNERVSDQLSHHDGGVDELHVDRRIRPPDRVKFDETKSRYADSRDECGQDYGVHHEFRDVSDRSVVDSGRLQRVKEDWNEIDDGDGYFGALGAEVEEDEEDGGDDGPRRGPPPLPSPKPQSPTRTVRPTVRREAAVPEDNPEVEQSSPVPEMRVTSHGYYSMMYGSGEEPVSAEFASPGLHSSQVRL